MDERIEHAVDGGARVSAPAWFAEHAQRFVASGGVAATPRRAATVLLLRPGTSGPEVFLHRRAATMAFAPGMYAFPGGSVDERDIGGLVASDVGGLVATRDIGGPVDRDLGWAGPDGAHWAGRLGLAEPEARAVVCAAVREVFEECGVLLAGPDESTVVGDVSGVEWEAARVALLAQQVALVELLTDRGLVLRSDLLAPWARWLTPEFEPRRFDTFFFLARLPLAQRTRDVGGESDHTVWLPPAQARTLSMLPPTAHTLRRLAEFADIDAALSAGAMVDVTSPLMPRLEVDQDGVWFTLS